MSKKALKNGHAEHIHANCDCQYAVRFDGKSNVSGYDPDKYLKMYNGDNPDAKPKEKINALRRRFEEERSNKARKQLEQTTMINNDIFSNEYRNIIKSIVEDEKAKRPVYESIKQIAEHRDGTYYEDLAYINTETGKLMINKDFDYYDPVGDVSMCKPNKPMNKMLENARERTIIGIHNHPKSGVPSENDIRVAHERKYKYGIVFGHNGRVFKYTVSEEFKRESDYEFWLANLEKNLYTEIEDNVNNALKRLRDFGIDMEVY